MSLWVCDEHGLYGGDVFCPKCGGTGSIVTIALCGAPAIAGEAQRGETVQQGSTGTASTRAEGIAQNTPDEHGDKG